jgi:hypothetical protein
MRESSWASPASRRRIDVEFTGFARYNDEGKLVEAWAYQDNLAFMQQIGAIPEEPPADCTDEGQLP